MEIRLSCEEATLLADKLRRAVRESKRTGGLFWAGTAAVPQRIEIGVQYHFGRTDRTDRTETTERTEKADLTEDGGDGAAHPQAGD